MSAKVSNRLTDLKSHRQIVLALFVFISLLYINTLFNDYNLDDELVTINHRLTSKGISAIPEILTSPYYQDNMGYSYEYRPIVLASFAIEFSLFGESPYVSHAINLLLYVSVCLLLFFCLTVLLTNISRWFILSVVLLFAAHPIHTEVVASIKNRDEILAMLGAVLSLQMLLFYTDKKKWPYFILSIIFFLFAMFSKKTIITAIIIIPVLLLLFRNVKLLPLILFITVCFVLSFPMLEFYNWRDIVTYALLLNGTILALYCLKHYRALTLALDNYFKSASSFSSLLNEGAYSLACISKSAFVSIAISVVLLSGILYYLKVQLFILPLLVLIMLPLFVRENIRDVSIIMLAFTVALITFLNKSLLFYEVSLIGFFALYEWLKDTDIRIKGILLAIGACMFIVGFLFPEQSHGSTYLFVFFILKQTRLKYVSFLIVFLIYFVDTVGNSIKRIDIIFNNFYFILDIFNALLLAVFFYPRILHKYTRIAVFIFICVVGALETIYNPTTYSKLLEPMVQLEEAGLPAVIEAQAYRPLEYVETVTNAASPIEDRLGTGMIILGKYIKQVIIPYPMSFYYGYKEIEEQSIYKPLPIIFLLVHIILLVIALLYFNKKPVLAAGLLIYLLSIVLYSNIMFPIPGMMADRFLFVPSLGFAMVLSWLLFKLYRVDISSENVAGWKNLNTWMKYTFLALLVLYSGLTFSRNLQWKNHLTLMRHDIRHLDNSAQAHNLLATNLMKYSFQKEYAAESNNMRKEAIIHFKKALAIYPDFFNVYYNLGEAYILMNDIDKAYPCLVKVHSMDSTISKVTLNIALIANSKGDYYTAIEHFNKLIRINPYVKEAYSNLSYIYFTRGQYDESIEVNKKAIQYNPAWKDPYQNIASVYLHLKDTLQAQKYIQEGQIKGRE